MYVIYIYGLRKKNCSTAKNGLLIKLFFHPILMKLGEVVVSMNQISVRPLLQSVAFDIVSRCFENKNTNCCENKYLENSIFIIITNP